MALFAAQPKVRVRDPFAVIPVKPDNVDLRHDSQDRIHLRLRIPVGRVKRWLATHLGYEYTRKIELDEFGTLYYSLADGRHSLRDILAALAARQNTEPARLEEAVVLFTRKLMTLNLLQLQVPPEVQFRSPP